MADTPGTGERGAAYWSKLIHVGVHQGAVELRPQLNELGLDEVHRICDRAWAYSRADFEPNALVKLATSQWRETCALAGSIAESLMLGAATYLESVWHSRAIAAGTEPAGMAIAQRYLADTSIDTAVSVGHRLINFVARVARTVPDTRQQLGSVKQFQHLGDTYVPFVTDAREAWLSLNPGSLAALRAAIPALHRDSVQALEDLVQSEAWEKLFQTRAENFHRWRKEHESVSGVDQNSGRASDIYDHAGNVIGKRVAAQPRRHTSSDGMTERTTEVAGEGVRAVSKAVEAVITDTLAVLPRLTGGFTLEIDRNGQTRRMSMPIF
ncbi:hypothetical protein [Mycobacterium deserti]|uniref:PPE family domain-containing protein n=1 Tax=Mycobacterium deserti TaxID=2978347 RepID=A0ABT2M5U0_9MYCO|nr:hypothetical protein [Mycobacterium deserti]MCT7657632.1 hypothetical protein [Mycobacterium deserti]